MTEVCITPVTDTPGTEETLVRLPRMMTITEAANLLDLSPLATYKLVKTGVLPGVRLGGALHDRGTIWIHPRDVMELARKVPLLDFVRLAESQADDD
jgi:excisionase family DNA binding protein